MIQRLQQKRNEEGFTLIELLIVIIVLGILAAIVVFAVGTTRDDAAASACKTDLKSVQLSAEAVKTKGGSYPLAAGQTATAAEWPGFDADPVVPNPLTDAAGNGALLKNFPTSDSYGLTYSRTATGYSITSTPAIAGCSAVG